ncbi:ALP1-like protein [Tanacetum coccineum]|uniref:ALP1-like protein n=1 Tax=Tanacetum coccineum TaxID=301880 RepID=A0ABQ5EEW5_9ASTR
MNGEGEFCVKDVRNLLDATFLPKADSPTRWIKTIPIKVNIFAWKVSLDRLPTRSNLARRGVLVPSSSCLICNVSDEDLAHLLFRCDLAIEVTRLVYRWWNLVWIPLDSYISWLSWIKTLRMNSRSKSVLEGKLIEQRFATMVGYRKRRSGASLNEGANGILYPKETLEAKIVNAVSNHSAYFQSNPDCARREGISSLIKCTSEIRQLAYGVNASFLDEYMQISERLSRNALDHFCQAVMEIYGLEYLRKPTKVLIVRIGSGLVVRTPLKRNMLDVIMVRTRSFCWKPLRHKTYGYGISVDGSNNDINVLYQSPLFNDLKTGRALEIPFVTNGVTYPSGYYLVDRIYPELATLVKTIPEPADDDHKRILYKKKQESARKDVERAFGVLKKKWAILVNLTRALRKDRIVNMMYTCIILHNMIRKYKKYAISPKWFPKEAHQPEDMLRNEEQVQQVMRWIRSSHVHQNLRHDLIEHLAQNA